MKVAIVCAHYLLVLASLTVECHRHSKSPSQECQETHHVTEAELSSIDRGEFELFKIEMKYKCYAQCLLQRTDYLDPMGKLSLEKLSLREDIAEEKMLLIAACKDDHEDEDDPCEYGFGVIACVMTVIQSGGTTELYLIN